MIFYEFSKVLGIFLIVVYLSNLLIMECGGDIICFADNVAVFNKEIVMRLLSVPLINAISHILINNRLNGVFIFIILQLPY